MRRLLLVEDDEVMLANNTTFFESRGFSVFGATALAAARAYLSRTLPDAILLDIMLPDGNGLDFLRELRAKGNDVPVLLLTAWGRDADMINGFEAGANEYVAKPFEYAVLLKRVENLFKNIEHVPETMTIGALRLDLFAHQAFLYGVDLLLTQKEFAILLLLAQNAGRVVDAAYIYEKVWGQSIEDDKNPLRFQMSKLRKKLQDSGFIISAEYGGGYVLEIPKR